MQDYRCSLHYTSIIINYYSVPVHLTGTKYFFKAFFVFNPRITPKGTNRTYSTKLPIIELFKTQLPYVIRNKNSQIKF